MLRLLLFAFIIIFISFSWTNCSNSFTDGKALYEQHCQNCHMPDGIGLRNLIPPLAGADFLEKNYDDLPCLLIYGIDKEIVVNGKTYHQPMKGIPDLETIEVALLINYINHTWGNDAKYTDFREVEENLKKCQ